MPAGVGGSPRRTPLSFSAAIVFDPATLALSAWWRASFAASPWVGTASAGTSGTHDLSEATNPLTPGAAVNGFTPASADGVDDSFTGGAIDTFYTPTAYTVSILAKFTDAAAPTPFIYANDAFVTEQVGNTGVFFSTSGVAAYHFDVAIRETGWVACSADAWHQIDAVHSAAGLKIRVDGGGWTAPVGAGGSASLGAGSLFYRVARNADSSKYSNVQFLEIIASQATLADADLDNIKSYRNARYALSL